MRQISYSNSRRLAGGGSTSRAGSPDACSSRSRTVTDRRSAPRQSWKNAPTRSSSRRRSVATSSITTVVVARTLVSEARSNGVSMAAASGGSAVSVPTASRHSVPAVDPTSTAAAGKVRAAIASSKTRRALSSEPEDIAPRSGRTAPDCLREKRHYHRGGGANEHVPGERDAGPAPDDRHRHQTGEHAGECGSLRDGRRQCAEQKCTEHRSGRVRQHRETRIEHRPLHQLRTDRDPDLHDAPDDGPDARYAHQG